MVYAAKSHKLEVGEHNVIKKKTHPNRDTNKKPQLGK